MSFDLSQLEKLPIQPGVYLMKDKLGNVLYVGKAINLRQRVKQYFTVRGDGRAIIPILVEQVSAIETIVVTSEKEALLLENTLIKQKRPKYNALLKDDKTYVALKINNKHIWPMVQLVRYKGTPEPDGIYFGPYTSAYAAHLTLELIHRIFPLRQCSNQELARRTRPCILYDMKRCIAPCVNKCTKEEYDLLVNRATRFLRGQDKEILKDLYEEMNRYVESLEFEKAALVHKTICHIENTLEQQRVDKPLGTDVDAIAIFRQAEEVIVAVLVVRAGKLLGVRHSNFSNIVEEDSELLSSYLLQHYEKIEELPEEILLPKAMKGENEIADILSTNKKKKVRIYHPQRGDKLGLVEMAYLNAEATFKREKDQVAIREKTLLELQEKLRLTNYPSRIECFDNSNIGGTEPVAAMVVFKEGVKDPQNYRKYKIKTVSGPDDYSTMYEVLIRRYKRAKEEGNLPDLIIIDGGKGHLNIAIKAFAELNIITVDLIAVAKEQGRHDKGVTLEQVFLPNIKDPILLRTNSPVLFLLQQIRDEAHRFAITFHRKRRNKQTLRNALEDIPGIGPKKGKKLLLHFGSIKLLKQATLEDLQKVEGLSQANIEALLVFIKNNSLAG